LASVAFPAISTGVYGFPIRPAAEIAVATVRDFLRQRRSIQEVVFCCFSAGDYRIYSELLGS
jgi:O-acetyl-ADP-ribose deacetylase (regulator of RNase III)